MNKKERKHRLALTLLFSALVFCIIFVAVVLSGIIVFILAKSGMIYDVNMGPNLRNILLFMGVVSIVIGVGLTALLGKFSLKPVNRIVDQMNRLASGDFKARLNFGNPIGAHSTFTEISESFNKMAQELENTEMLREDFINNFSHEFKTPIVSVAGFAKLLKRGNLTEEEKAEYIDIIEEESMRLAEMATNVLNLTKYENQSILTDTSEFNLSEEIRASILSLEGKWSRKKIDFGLDFDEYMIVGNRDMLRHVWINLIDNAIKFSSEGGNVEVGIYSGDGFYDVSVLNHGQAITPEQQTKIFNKFYQADESHASEGNGIGLALVKKVVELHRGSVSVKCENGATVFTVRLPAVQ